VRKYLVSTLLSGVGIFTLYTAGVHDLFSKYLPKDPAIRIIEATYGDKTSHKTCTPNLSICSGQAECSFQVDDGLCAVDAPVKNLEVVWDCGDGTDKHARAAAKGTRISLECVSKKK
jgi:hypothetical protein